MKRLIDALIWFVLFPLSVISSAQAKAYELRFTIFDQTAYTFAYENGICKSLWFGTGSFIYTCDAGTTVTITGTSVLGPGFDGFQISKWHGDCIGAVGSMCKITMNGNKSFGASLESAAGAEAFVKRLYRELLGREAQGTELENLPNQLKFHQLPAEELAQAFVFSQEFINGGMNNSDFLDALYSAFFNRSADGNGKTFWLAKINAGGDRKTILDGFTGSPEFSILVGLFQTPTEQFVNNFYQKVLLRKPDSQGLSYWSQHLDGQTKTGADVAFGFVFSREFAKRNVSNEAFVATLFKAIFLRDPVSWHWSYTNPISQLNQNTTSRMSVLNSFIADQEFIDIAVKYGITAN